MKLGLEIKNPKKVIKPSTNDVILYDGKAWYVTTKQDLFKEFEERIAKKEKELDSKIKECNSKIAEVDNLKKDVANQLLTFGEIVRKLVSKEDK